MENQPEQKQELSEQEIAANQQAQREMCNWLPTVANGDRLIEDLQEAAYEDKRVVMQS